jgi:hypothetical protein
MYPKPKNEKHKISARLLSLNWEGRNFEMDVIKKGMCQSCLDSFGSERAQQVNRAMNLLV